MDETIMGFIRRVYPSDGGAVTDHLLRLNALDRRLRFYSAMSDSAIQAHVARLDWWQAAVFGYVVDGCIRGVAELLPERRVRPRSAEAAFSVEAGWRGKGIGGALMRRVLSAAAARSIGRVELSTEIGNLPMRRIAARHGAAFTLEGGDVFAAIAVPAARPAGVLLGTWVEAGDAILATADQVRRWSLAPQASAVAPRP